MQTFLVTLMFLLVFAITPAWGGEAASASLRQEGAEIVAEVEYLTLNSVDAEGFPQTRVVSNFHKGNRLPLEQDGKIALYFVTSSKTGKIQQFRNNPKASAYYQDPSAGTAVLYTGLIEEVKDSATRQLLWSDWLKSMYSSVDDPDFVVLRLVPTRIKVDFNGEAEQGDL